MKIPLAKPVINKEMIEAAINALQNEKLVFGESVYKFEEEFAKYLGVKYAVAVNSGSTALLFSYMALQIGKGNGVLAPSATFVSTVASATLCGATPYFGDISLDTYTLDVSDVRRRVEGNKDVKVVVPVHLYGNPVQMDPLLDLAEDLGIAIVEDCAQALGATYKGKKVGTFGDISIFSFYPTKNITVGGDGGMVVTNDPDIADKVKTLRDNGRKSKNTHVTPGYTARLNTVNAAIGRVQLKYLDKWNRKRRDIAEEYRRQLKHLDEVALPIETKDGYHVYHLFVIRVKDRRVRSSLGAWLAQRGIQAAIHYPIPVHKQPIYQGSGFSKIELPNTEKWAKTVLSLPMFPELSKDEVRYISESISEFFEKKMYKAKEHIKEGERWERELI